jgi:hypothetical protein
MKAMLVAIQPKWLKMILDGDKKFLFRNWKVPVGTVLYFYESKGKKRSIDVWEQYPYYYCYRDDNGQGMLLDYIREGRGKVVAKAVVKEVWDEDDISCALFEEQDLPNYFAKCGYTDQKYALELDQVQAIEPKDITEFVSWSKLDKARKERNKKEDIQTALKYGDWQMEYDTTDKFVDYYGTPKECKLTKPPQSRTWIYVK